MKRFLVLTALLAVACISFAGVAKADTITQGGVSYTFTAGEADGGGVFDVVVTIDTTGATASGSLAFFSVQFTGATNATLESASANTGGWTKVQSGGNNANGCDGTGNFFCASGPAIAVTANNPGANDVYTFVFDIDMGPNGTLPTESDIKAFQSQGDLAISHAIGVGTTPPSVPEPASLTLLGLGLAGLPFLRRKRS